ncbi:MAG: signal peptidase I [Bacteroidia bacterium]
MVGHQQVAQQEEKAGYNVMVSRVTKIGSYLKRYLNPAFTNYFFITLFIFLCIKQFVFDVVIVQSPGMNNTLKQGEMVFVNKLFTAKRNDVVRISLPLAANDSGVASSYSFKRIAAGPGDTVEIRDSKLRVNGSLVAENDIFLHNYIAKIKTRADSMAFDSAGIDEKVLIDDSCVYLISITNKKFAELNEKKTFYSLATNSEDSADHDENVFPFSKQYNWNEDYFGPLYIPKKGDVLLLDTNTVKIYKRIIVDFEGSRLEVKDGHIFINGDEIYSFVTKQNYFFVTGDNFDNSVDSRNWGFVPENRIKSRLVFK